MDKSYTEEAFPILDTVVGNPPYTRQEELERYIPNYKSKLEKILQKDWGRKFDLGKRSSIYAHFFIHGVRFLKENGRFGYVTSNSWLDVDYGKYLQEFFLKNTRIIAIIESKVERWFEDADINTVITILERCKNEKERNKNIIKFVQLKVPLKDLILSADNEEERWKVIEKLVNFIEKTNTLHDDTKLRIYPKNQNDLWDEGFDEEKEQYVGSKWEKYVRAPDIFFKTLEKGKDLFVPLKRKIADVKRGFTTGVNEFFYITDEQIKEWKLEKEFWMHKNNGKWVPNYVVKSPKEISSIYVIPEGLKYCVLLINKDKKELKGTNVLKYIQWGEEQGFDKRPTCKSRNRWYELPVLPTADILFRQFFDVTFNFPLQQDNYLTDHTFYYLCLKDRKYSKAVVAILNSTFYTMIVEIFGRTVMGQGVLITYGPEMKPIPMILPSAINKKQIQELEKALDSISKRPIKSVFEEIAAKAPDEVSLDKIKSDRRKLDKIVMGDILGLTEQEQLEVYKTVIDLVKSRKEKAKSVENTHKSKDVDINALAESILKEIDTSALKFPGNYINGYETINLKVPKGEPKIISDLSGIFVEVDGSRIDCKSKEEACFIYYCTKNKKDICKIPKDKKVLKQIVKEYSVIYDIFIKTLNQNLESLIHDRKIRGKVEDKILKKAFDE